MLLLLSCRRENGLAILPMQRLPETMILEMDAVVAACWVCESIAFADKPIHSNTARWIAFFIDCHNPHHIGRDGEADAL